MQAALQEELTAARAAAAREVEEARAQRDGMLAGGVQRALAQVPDRAHTMRLEFVGTIFRELELKKHIQLYTIAHNIADPTT